MLEIDAPEGYAFQPRGHANQVSLKKGDVGRGRVPVLSLPFVIGRAYDCDLLLPDSEELRKTTSRWHCYLSEKEGEVIIRDGSLRPIPETGKIKPSGSGTWINDKRLDAPARLRAGDVIRIGPWRFSVEDRPNPSVDIDDMLKTLGGQPSRLIEAGDPRLARSFARLPELLARIGQARRTGEGLSLLLEFALARIEQAVVAAVIEERPGGALGVRAALHREHGRVRELKFSAGLLAGLPEERAILLKAGAKSVSKSQLEQKISSGLVVPLLGREGRVGVLYLDNRGSRGSLGEADLYLAHALASVASLQISLERQAFLSRLEQNMRQYFGPDAVSFIVEASRSGKPLGLGVRRCEATVLFVDLQGFSALCRDRPPEEVADLLSPYYRLVSECVQEHSGHVDKFLGDGVMCLFGAQPTSAPKLEGAHAVLAARAARRMISAWSEGYGQRSGLPIRAGLHTGTVVAGNIGFSGRMEYSALGDAVNLAARMEKLARPNGAALSDSTRALLGEEFPCRDGGVHEVHGFGPTRVWHLD